MARTRVPWGLLAGPILLLVALAAYRAALDMRPLDADNLIALSIAHEASPRFLTDNFVSYVPGYRPLAYLTLWGQYQLFGLGPAHLFAFNLLAAVAAALGGYAIVVAATGARALALLPAAAVLLDERLGFSQIWLGERQSTLACALGAAALALSVPALTRPLSRPRIAGIAVLILAASACKEYGIAFAAGVAVLALLGVRQRRAALLAAAVVPVAAYLMARAALAGVSLAGYCETMGLPGRESREVCYDDLGLADRLAQHGWNVAATFAGTFAAPLFDASGAPVEDIEWRRMILPACAVALAAAGLWSRPRVVLALLAVIAVNAVLNLALYRTRNQLAGTLALDVAAGIGFVALARAWWPRRVGRAAVVVAATVIVAWLAVQATKRDDFVHEYRAIFAAADPCAAVSAYPRDVDPAVAHMVTRRFRPAAPPCAPTA